MISWVLSPLFCFGQTIEPQWATLLDKSCENSLDGAMLSLHGSMVSLHGAKVNLHSAVMNFRGNF
jgi:hypothetical protein